ncbi:bifunctional helix-turn-helix transcriptional regulator/GNAT family N-acetyltransferase [Mariniblastus fucicola]|uniref:Acetyltransferase (GNAT) family protein n=1 Tax=Mariniblastus fucicola TaxID=980251 RepID=A0A5B9P9S9_9BACT|nr:bifunctional helix-turn-helix transcriptional regulator/GNAT family N-acetyltransferase [Mariniblastus fucicola]QEG21702.1 Acetyltransferase (GNAT) family protein [Mariniblastus fucicola]
MSRSEIKKTINEIRKHSRQFARELDVIKGVYLGTGYTLTQCHVMFELSSRGSMGLMQLAEVLLLDKSNTSRTVKQLVQKGVLKSRTSPTDSRQKSFSLTAKGKKALAQVIDLADVQVESAIDLLSSEEQATVIEGLKLYSNALRTSRIQSEFPIRKIKKADNPQIARVIRSVMTEFGAVGEGYSINDAEVDTMFGSYRGQGTCYYVVVKDEKVVGGAGIGPLQGGDGDVCELRKMFFMPEARGCGLGSKLLRLLLDEARRRGYRKCYLETLDRMEAAKLLYERFGFKPLKRAMGNTGHCSCDCWYLLDL